MIVTVVKGGGCWRKDGGRVRDGWVRAVSVRAGVAAEIESLYTS